MPELDRIGEAGLAERFARSARAPGKGAADVLAWLAERAAANHFRVDRVPFAELDGWAFDPDTGNLAHRTGRFFSVKGLRVRVAGGAVPEWHQPIIDQPEAGILGILAKEFDGVLHFLMHAKMEPGNTNLLQLSPTVQATPSNYGQVHRGAAVKYLDYFLRPELGRELVHVLQSEHGAWFFRKSNRNMIVEAAGEVPLLDDYRWLTLGEIGELLECANIVNMDSRTVLSCAPVTRTEPLARHRTRAVRSWLTGIRAARPLHAERVPLAGLPDWTRTDTAIGRADGRHFRIVATAVQAGSREVSAWTQPLLEPLGAGVVAFLTARLHGVRHVLAHARVEAGCADHVEIAPTVQAVPDSYAGGAPPRFLDRVLAADPDRIRFDTELSEEGGRFLNAVSRYMLVETDDLDEPPGYRWVTPGQLAALVGHAHYVNVQARTLLTCLTALDFQ